MEEAKRFLREELKFFETLGASMPQYEVLSERRKEGPVLLDKFEEVFEVQRVGVIEGFSERPPLSA